MGISKGPGEFDPEKGRTAPNVAMLAVFMGGLVIEGIRNAKKPATESSEPQTDRTTHEDL